MKLYIMYSITAVLHFYVMMVYFGVSAGFANYFPIIALLGVAILFVVAAPVIVYRSRLGLLLGLVGCVCILPYSLMFMKGVFEDGINWITLLVALPTILLLVGTYLTLTSLFAKRNIETSKSAIVKALLSATPIVLFFLYMIIYGKYFL